MGSPANDHVLRDQPGGGPPRPRPALVQLPRRQPARVEVVLGDARLTLAAAPPRHYDLLALDAFSSDAIPMHLLTREALRLYLDKLSDGGVVAMHITNRYLNLAPILARLAQDAGLACRDRSHDTSNTPDDYASHWVMMSRRADLLRELTTGEGWKDTLPGARTPLWTDDFSNILSAGRVTETPIRGRI